MAKGEFGRNMSKKAREEMMRELADGFIEAIQKNEFGAWKKGWACSGIQSVPHNVRGTRYRGLNTIILWLEGMQYNSSQWATYNQWKELSEKHAIKQGEFDLVDGRNGPWKKTSKWYGVRKGESGTTVVFWKPTKYTTQNDDGEDEERASLMMKVYTVFNRDQTDLPPEVQADDYDPAEEFTHAENDFNDCLVHYLRSTDGGPISLRYGGNRAFYMPGRDVIALPHRRQFESNLHYLSVKGHECVHSTGHTRRLARPLSGGKQSQEYAFEELIAELGSAFLMGTFGLSGDMRHTEYLASWVSLLSDAPEALMKAASKAQKAVDFIVDPYLAHKKGDCECAYCTELAELRAMLSDDDYPIPYPVWESMWMPEIVEDEEE